MNSKKNANAIRRYCNTSCSDSDYVTNPIKVNTNAFALFTNSLSYYKTKYQHKHFDVAHEPYKITFDKARVNAYIKWSDIHDANVSLFEQKQIAQVISLACDYAFSKKIELNVSNIKDIVIKECPMMYFNDVSVAQVISHYKKSMRNDDRVVANNKKILSLIRDMFNSGVEISTDSVKQKLPTGFYVGCSIISELVAHFKQLNKNQKPCWVFKKKTSAISKGAKKLGKVVSK
jgi:hypothetical protein